MADSDEIRINDLEQPNNEKSSKSYTTPSFSYQKDKSNLSIIVYCIVYYYNFII